MQVNIVLNVKEVFYGTGDGSQEWDNTAETCTLTIPEQLASSLPIL